jgi:hypothetical protein
MCDHVKNGCFEEPVILLERLAHVTRPPGGEIGVTS